MGRTDQPRDARIWYDLFMGLARCTAMPITVAAALLCAPLAAQTRPSENNAKRLIEKADRLAWLYNWYLAGPLYAEAEKLFEQAGDSRNALYAKIGRLRSEWETMSFPEVSEYLPRNWTLRSLRTIRGFGCGSSTRRGPSTVYVT